MRQEAQDGVDVAVKQSAEYEAERDVQRDENRVDPDPAHAGRDVVRLEREPHTIGDVEDMHEGERDRSGEQRAVLDFDGRKWERKVEPAARCSWSTVIE